MIVMVVMVPTFHRGPYCYEEHTVHLASRSLQRGILLTRKPGDDVDGDLDNGDGDGDDGDDSDDGDVGDDGDDVPPVYRGRKSLHKVGMVVAAADLTLMNSFLGFCDLIIHVIHSS